MPKTVSPGTDSFQCAPNSATLAARMERLWRRPALRRRSWRRRMASLAIAIGLLTLLAALAAVGSWFAPMDRVSVVMIGADYELNLAVPHNVYGWNALSRLERLVESRDVEIWGRSILEAPSPPMVLDSSDNWRQSLQRLGGGTALIFVAVHGGSDGDGAYFLTNDATIDQGPRNRLRLEPFLDEIAKLPDSMRKVVVLDATRIASNCELGMLDNQFARCLASMDNKIAAIPNCVVLCASDVNQRSQIDPCARETVFANRFLTGLCGAAPDTNENGRLSASEIFAYCRTELEAWSNDGRAMPQTPVLLPLGDEGLARARRIDLAPAASSASALCETSPPVKPLPRWLQDAWTAHAAFLDRTPQPYVFLPHLWRRYEAMLLRAESLHAAGDEDGAIRMMPRIVGASNRLEQLLDEGVVDPLPADLPLLRALGFDAQARQGANDAAPSLDDMAVDCTNRLLAASPAERDAIWQSCVDRAGDSSHVLKALVFDQLLLRAAKDPQRNLAATASLARQLLQPWEVAPPSIELLTAMAGNLPPVERAANWDIIGQALSIRRMADRAACGAGAKGPIFVAGHPLIRAAVDEGDASRRSAEDLLFVGETSYANAEKQLTEARARYETALATSEPVNHGIALYIDLARNLPYYSRWIAANAAEDAGSTGSTPLVDMAIASYGDMHELRHQLLMLPPLHETSDDPMDAAAIRALRSHVTESERRYQSLRSGVEGLWRRCETSTKPLRVDELDDLLSVPLHSLDTRMALLAKRGRTSHHPAKTASDGAQKRTTSHRVSEARDRLLLATAEGRLHLALLGQLYFDKVRGDSGSLNYEQVDQALLSLSTTENWAPLVASLGDAIGRRWRMLPGYLDREVSNLALMKESRDREDRFLTLSTLFRRTPACIDLPDELLLSYRLHGRRTLGFLAWQAERSLDDHWCTPDERGSPYFQSLARRLLDYQATQLTPLCPIAPNANLEAALERPWQLQWAAPDALDLTSEPSVTIRGSLELVKDGFAPPGTVATWIDVPKGFSSPDAASPRRVAYAIASKDAPKEILYTLHCDALVAAESAPPSTPSIEAASATIEGFYRGQRLKQPVVLRQHMTPIRTLATTPVPDRATIRVAATSDLVREFGEGRGAVAIVLDASGSMGPPDGQPFAQATKYAEATSALRTMLANTPRDTLVSVWVFGEAVGSAKTVDDPDATIRRVQPPVAWDPTDAALIENVLSRVAYPAVEPWNKSPILEAMLHAKTDVESAPGYRSVLVLTDGMDNCFEQDKKNNAAGATVAQALRNAFDGSGVAVHIVGFKMAEQEAAVAKAQFAEVSKFSPPGDCTFVDDIDALLSALDRSLHQSVRYWIRSRDDDKSTWSPPTGRAMDVVGGPERWLPGGLPVGDYAVTTRTGQLDQRWFALAPGDLLAMELQATPQGAALVRSPYVARELAWKPSTTVGDWRLALLRNQRSADHAIDFLLALEQEPAPGTLQLSMPRPTELWIETDTHGDTDDQQPIIRWTSFAGYPVATWQGVASNWPDRKDSSDPAAPSIRAWWSSDDRTPPTAVLRINDDAPFPATNLAHAVLLGESRVVVQSITIEEHVVETKPGVREKQPCLTVRVRYPEGSPIWARPRGLTSAGTEHRYYPKLGAYTGLFWPITEARASHALTGLEFVSVNAFKAFAETRSRAAALKDLAPPSPGDAAPAPPIDWYEVGASPSPRASAP